MIFTYLSFSLAIIFISFIVGMAIHAVLKNTEIYKTTLSSLNFIKREKLNKWIGVGFIQWVVKINFDQNCAFGNSRKLPIL